MRTFVIGLIISVGLLLVISQGQTPSVERLHIIMCDVGQGDAFLLTLGTTQVLIDGGPVESKVLSCLARHLPRWDTTIELVIATHADSDHITGLVGVLQKYRVKTLLISHSTKQSAVFDRLQAVVQRCVLTGTRVIAPAVGQTFSLGANFSATVLHPHDAQPLLQRSSATDGPQLSTSSRRAQGASIPADCAGLKPDHKHTKSDLVRRFQEETVRPNWQLAHFFPELLSPSSAFFAHIRTFVTLPQVVLASGQTAGGSGHGLKSSRETNLENTEVQLQDVTAITIAQTPMVNTDENDGSIVVLFDFGNTTYLFTGDIGGEIELSLLENPLTLGVDVLKTSHHGSKTGTVEAFLEATRPEWALISAGVDNSYGHPDTEVLSRLEKVGSHVLRTDLDGEIELQSDGESIWLENTRGKN